jgi:hypothetical protein
VSAQAWWYVARASGIVAWALLVASVVWGVLLATRVLRPHDRPAWLLDLHRWLGGLAVAATGLHVAALVADTYVHFGAADVLVPFASSWRPLAVALGILAGWGLAAVQATSLAMRHLPRRAWYAVHLTSYVTVWLASIHAGLAGTDTTNLLYRAVAVALTVAAAVATLTRVRAGRRGRGPRDPRPRPSAAAATALDHRQPDPTR